MLCRAHECYIQAAAAPISVERLALAATRCVRTTETCVLVRYTAGGVMCTAWGQSHMNYKKAVTFRVRSPRDVVTRCHRRPQGDCKGTCRRRRSDAMCTQSTDFKKNSGIVLKRHCFASGQFALLAGLGRGTASPESPTRSQRRAQAVS